MVQAKVQTYVLIAPDQDIEIWAAIEARPIRCDYGVPGSPVWTEFEDHKIIWPIEIDGADYTEAQLKTAFPDLYIKIEEAILEAAADLDDVAWE